MSFCSIRMDGSQRSTTDRLIDVNINRLGEALKIIEDLTRFGSKNLTLLGNIRNLRGAIARLLDRIDYPKVVRSRRTDSDPGSGLGFDRPGKDNLQKQMIKSFARAKQAARVLEELLDRRWKSIRFRIYELEQIVLSPRSGLDLRFYLVWDEQYLDRRTFEKNLSILIKGGVTAIQFRVSRLDDKTYLRLLRKARKEIPNGITMIVNNRIDLALASGADGVHLGLNDLPVKDARRIGGPSLVIGATIRRPSHLKRVEPYADYLGVGSIFPSPTKPDAEVIGISNLKKVIKKTRLPVVAIGGITPELVNKIFDVGIGGVAISSSIFRGSLRKNLQVMSGAIYKK